MKTLHLASLCSLTLLAACGGGGDKTATQGDGKVVSVAAGAAVECKDLPPYAELMSDAAVSVCSRGQTRPGHVSGSVLYTSAMAPEAVIAFYKEKAAAAGLHDGMNVPGMYSAVDGAKRSMMVMPKVKDDGKTHVVLNWGRDE